MNDHNDLRKALVRTGDGKSVLFWTLVFSVLLVRSMIVSGLDLNQLRYIFSPILIFAIFCQFRVNDSSPDPKTNVWGLINANGFGFFLIYLEFFK
jgi:hypothetical protein